MKRVVQRPKMNLKRSDLTCNTALWIATFKDRNVRRYRKVKNIACHGKCDSADRFHASRRDESEVRAKITILSRRYGLFRVMSFLGMWKPPRINSRGQHGTPWPCRSPNRSLGSSLGGRPSPACARPRYNPDRAVESPRWSPRCASRSVVRSPPPGRETRATDVDGHRRPQLHGVRSRIRVQFESARCACPIQPPNVTLARTPTSPR